MTAPNPPAVWWSPSRAEDGHSGLIEREGDRLWGQEHGQWTPIDELPADAVRLAAPPAHPELVRAIADPGQFVPRGDDYHEPIPSWSARAVTALLAGNREQRR